MNKVINILLLIIILLFNGFLPALAQSPTKATEESINDRVKAKIEEAKNKPKAFLGTITDKLGNGFQIKNLTSGIEQVEVDESTTYIKTDNKSNLKADYKDLAIGDFIIAMGYINPANTFTAKRILISSLPVQNKRTVTVGKVSHIETSQLEITNKKDGKTLIVKPAKTLSVLAGKSDTAKKTKFSEIKEKDLIVAVGEVTDSLMEARKIYIISTFEVSPTPLVTKSPSPTKKILPTASPTPEI